MDNFKDIVTFKNYVRARLDTLMPIFATAAIGDFSRDVEIPEEEDEFTQLYVGVQVMLDVIREQLATLEEEISKHKEAEEALFQREKEFKALADNSPDIISRFDRQLRHVFVNRAVEKVTGIPAASYIGKTNAQLGMPKELDKYWSDSIMSVFKTGREATIEFEFPAVDGSHHYQARLVPETGKGGSIEYVLGVVHDITGLTQTALSLKKRTDLLEHLTVRLEREKARTEAMLKGIGEGLIVTDAEGNIRIINDAAQSMLGYRQEECFDKIWGQEIPVILNDSGERIPYEETATGITLKTAKRQSTTQYFTHKNGKQFPVLVTTAPIFFEKKMIGVVIVFRDMTREKEIDKMKDEFISIASHELRTPMTAIKGYISMIFQGDYGPVDKKLERPLRIIATSTERLIQMVRDILDVSRIESDKIIYSESRVALKPVIEEVISSLRPIADGKGLFLEVPDLPDLHVHADPEKVKQILYNIVGNAIKFTAKGKVRIFTETDGNFVKILVHDTGIGIPPDDQHRLFGKFQQVSSATSGRPGGTGLGLYISRQLARRMGGDVWLFSSQADQGSIFALSLLKEAPKITERKQL